MSNPLAKLAKKTRQVSQDLGDAIRQAFRGKLGLVDSSLDVQRVQVQGLAGEMLQDVELIQQFGFTSYPPADADVVVIPLGGNTSHGVVLATEHGSYRLKSLGEGEVAVYDQSGSSIVLKKGKLIEINCDNLVINAAQKVQITTPLVEASQAVTAQGLISGNAGLAIQGGDGGGNVQINCDIDHHGNITNNGKNIGATHTHTETNTGSTLGVD